MDFLAAMLAVLLGICTGPAFGSSTPVVSDVIAMDEPGFTSYVEKRLQLYSSASINIIGTFELSVKKGDAETDLPSLRTVHESCVQDQSDCQHFVDSYIQNMVLYIQQFHLDEAVPPATEPDAAVSSVDAQQGHRPPPATEPDASLPPATEPDAVLSSTDGQLGHSPPPPSTTLRVCNRTQQRLAIAVSFVPKGEQKWQNRGWKYIPGNKCDAVLTTAGNTFYARAQQGFDIGLGTAGDIKLCVQYPGGYSYSTKNLETSCANGSLAGFRTFHATGSPVIVWNVDS